MRLPLVAWLLAATLPACHVGPPPAPAGGAPRLTRVSAPVAEPGLADALRGGMGQALAERAVARPGPGMEALVLEASTDVVAVTDQQRVHRVRLVVAFQRTGPDPARLVLHGERSYVVSSTDGLSAAQARAQAFAGLSLDLARDAAAWATQAPAPAPVPAPASGADLPSP